MEKVIMEKMRKPFVIRSGDVWCALFALVLGSVQGLMEPILVFLFLTHCYLRSTSETISMILFLFISLLTKDMMYLYFYALGIAFYFVLIYLVKLSNRNVYQWIPLINAISAMPFALLQYRSYGVFIIGSIVYALTREMLKEYSWIKQSFALSNIIYGGMFIGAGLCAGEIFPSVSYNLLLVFLSGAAFFCHAREMMLYVAALFLLTALPQPFWLLVALLVSVFKEEKIVAVTLLGLFGIQYAENLFHIIYLFVNALCIVIIKKEMLPFVSEETKPLSISKSLSQDNLLRRQLQNYASIFESLHSYYETMKNPHAELLESMAFALQYQADELEHPMCGEENKTRIIQALEGYQFAVENLHIEEFRDGSLRLHITISNLHKKEICTTLKPLLEGLLQRKMKVISVEDHRFSKGYDVVLQDNLPFEIEVDGDSLKNASTTSGDAFSIFHFRQSLVCMISDGMGNGEKAAQISHLVSSIFQKMVVSGIPQDNAIRCINKLMQSDTYATLDVICFNRSKGVAYLSKSAACPTWLLREHKLYELSGSALPVGIVSTIQPDCFEIELQDKDEFIMMSDGVEMKEVYAWMRERQEDSMREDVEIFMDILKRKLRKDDSTIILARVKEQ
ncbi:SpoIIE family protein phosphatase [Amedibacterium intestinale]|uniref:SpoIIE family protein phosphatase n=1 Tax=Amedibacterium intestinale TaxID=2583452 RepID=UPI003991DB06